MKLKQTTSEIFVPDGTAVDAALARTTHMAVSAHQDDIEIMATEGVMAGFGQSDKWFLAAIVTDGAGSPRNGLYEKYTDMEMRKVRRLEQKKAAYVGEYTAVAFLDYPSSAVKSAAEAGPKDDLAALINAARPEVIYTHNLADKHDTHVATALRVIAAIRSLPEEARPKKVYGCEVWRDLDWMTDSDKVVFQLDEHQNVAAAILGVFDSQIAGGKRYDLATQARRRAHATYFQSHAVDTAEMLNFGMDLTPLVRDASIKPADFLEQHIRRFSAEVNARLAKLS
ncbi:MAG: PIG-L family deacetylase [Acidobacteriales bacterium]|nr:PIG-L family deacetylase [Terriglobales bacterium]